MSAKKFYVVGDDDLNHFGVDVELSEIKDDEFKAMAEECNQVYTAEELCATLNMGDELSLGMDTHTQIRFL